MSAAGGEIIFAMDGVSYAYPPFPPSLVEVSLKVRRGERLVLLGANGSGKSTLLRILDGLYFPDSGRVEALGRPLLEEALESPDFGPRFRREVGFLFQNSEAQLFCPTVEEELAFGPLQLGMPEGEILRRIADSLSLLEIRRLRERSPAALSAGEKRRVALASLLVLSPSVLLLDEPTAGLDPRSQTLLLEILEDLHGAGLTLVTATHDLALVPHLADRVVVLGEDHRVAAEGTPRQILSDADLLLSVNLIHAHAHRHGDILHTHPHRHVVDHDHPHGGQSLPQTPGRVAP